MREIKFRQFDSLYKVMVEWEQLKEDIKQYGFEELSKNSIFMQCTGLKDRNGKEIYEGDIVEYVGRIGTKHHFTVEWSNVDASFNFGWMRAIYASNQGEVIGNIYENPNLLEG